MRTESSPTRPAPNRHRQTVQARDAGVSIARRITGWSVAGAVAIAGGLSAATAHAYHARTASAARRAQAGGAQARQPVDSGASTVPAPAPQDASTVPQPPASMPVPAAPAPVAPVVSGGS